LFRGKARLRERLVRRGFTLPAVLLGLSIEQVARAIPSSLAVSTLRLATAAPHTIPVAVRLLTTGVMRGMTTTFKILTVLVLFGVLGVAAAGIAICAAAADPAKPQRVPIQVARQAVGTGPGVAAQESAAKTDAQAKEAVVQFFKAFKAKDIDILMKAVDVPFCREGGKNIDKRGDLKLFFSKALEVRDPSKDTITVKLVTTLPKLEASEGKFTDDERKAVEAALGKDHRVVKVEWDRGGDGKHKALIRVRLQKGKAKVVGII
jgi:hypothetical protein